MAPVTTRELAAQRAAVKNLQTRVAGLEKKAAARSVAEKSVSEAEASLKEARELFEIAVACKDHKEAERFSAVMSTAREELKAARQALEATPCVAKELKTERQTLRRAEQELARLEKEASAQAAALTHSPFAGLWAAFPAETLAAK